MTLAHKTQYNNQSPKRSGFTLLEIVITLMIISVLLGSTVLFFMGESDEKVEELSRKTQLLAKSTMRNAKEHQRAYSLYISGKSIWAEAEQTEFTENLNKPSNTIEVDEDIVVSYMLDAESGWRSLGLNDAPFVWTFTKSGICNPLTVRFENEIAVDEISFHPLTAGKVVDEN